MRLRKPIVLAAANIALRVISLPLLKPAGKRSAPASLARRLQVGEAREACVLKIIVAYDGSACTAEIVKIVTAG